jgi:hypothetical protein
LLYLEATLALIDGDVEAAAAAIPIMLKVVAPLAEEPALVAYMQQVAGIAQGVTLLENTLRVGDLPAPTLLDLEGAFTACEDGLSLKWALYGERALFTAMLDEVHPGVAGYRGSLWRVLALVRYGDQRQGTDMIGWLLAADDDPAALRTTLTRIEQYLSDAPRSHIFTRMVFQALPRAVAQHLDVTARVRAARTMLAAARYRLAASRLPETLDVLVPAYLAAIPADPWIDASLRGVLHPDGLVVYSVGEDGVDDGGSVTSRDGARRPRDLGVQLRD